MTAQVVTAGGPERIHRIAYDIYRDAFKDDPAFVYVLEKYSDSQRYDFLAPYFAKLLTACGINGGIFEEVDDYAGAAVIMPPGTYVDKPFSTLLRAGMASFLFQPGPAAIRKMLFEFGTKTDKAKAKHLKVKRYYYLFFIAVSPNHQRKGYASTLLKSLQGRAAKENLPIWLEASTEGSMQVYAKNGFKTVDTLFIGKGKVGADGRRKANGEGVQLWAMVWWPPNTESAKVPEA